MGCLYCGHTIEGRRRKFCSDRCCRNYFELIRQRNIKGSKLPLAWCENCGKLLKYRQKQFCSKECERRRKKLLGSYAPLVYAILKQAKEDGALEYMFRTGSIYQLLPGTDPDYLQRLMKGETR